MSNGNDKAGKMLLAATAAGATAAIVNRLLAVKPVEAAPPDARLDYLIELQEAIVALLGQILAATGVAPPGIEVIVKTPWVAKDPEQIYSHDIRVAGTFYSDTMVDWTRGKRLLIVVQSSLNQTCQIQLIGNFVDDMTLATDINAALPCPANSNISVGCAWDDYHCFVGVRITTAVAPTAGILNIWSVVQE